MPKNPFDISQETLDEVRACVDARNAEYEVRAERETVEEFKHFALTTLEHAGFYVPRYAVDLEKDLETLKKYFQGW